MNSQDNSHYPGLDALKGERAPGDLHSKVLLALQPQNRHARTRRVLKYGFATAVVFVIAFLSVLAPRLSFAAAISRVLKAFQAIHRYHVKSYKVVDGKRQLVSETWVDGEKRKFTLYDSDGAPIPNSDVYGETSAKIDKTLRGLTPEQKLDPTLKDKLNKMVSSIGPNSGFVTERITIDGKEVSDLPEGMKQAIRDQMFRPGPAMPVGGEPDVSNMLSLLKDPSNWDIAHDQKHNGKTVDGYSIKHSDKNLLLAVDPVTSLPVSLQVKTSISGEEITMIDEFDYPGTGP